MPRPAAVRRQRRPGPGRGGGRGPAPTPDRATWYASPYKVFDNLYWLGTRQHSSWALRTSDGLVILDTNFAWATEPEIINGLTTLGLDPRQIKYVVISHAHGDHDQGAAELQKRFGAKVVMGAPDWESTLQRPATAAGGVPTRDVVVGPAGMKLTLGDTTIDIVSTPGTYARHVVLCVPGEGSGPDGDGRVFRRHADRRVRHQLRRAGTNTSTRRSESRKAAADAGATRDPSNHSEYDNAYTKARLIAAKREVGEEHPFVVGTAGVQRYFTVMTECAMASKLRVGAK